MGLSQGGHMLLQGFSNGVLRVSEAAAGTDNVTGTQQSQSSWSLPSTYKLGHCALPYSQDLLSVPPCYCYLHSSHCQPLHRACLSQSRCKTGK